MTVPSGDRELFEDVELLCDGRLDPGRLDGLQARLKGDPRALGLYLDYVDTHLALGRLVRSGRAAVAPIPPPVRGPSGTRRARLVRLGAAASVLAILGAGWLVWGRSTREAGPESGAPVLAQSSGARFFGRGALPRGTRLRFDEEYALAHGLAEVAFADGASAILRAPAVFVVAGRARLVMKLGRCSVHAPDGAEGFRVETPSTDVVDLGTRFSVEVAEAGGTDVQVLEGLAEVRPGAGGGSARLAAGQARRYPTRPGSAAEVLPFDPARYTGRLPDRVVSYAATGPDGGAEELLGVSVQRGGAIRRYSPGELIGIDLVHFHSGGGTKNLTTGLDEVEIGPGRAGLLDRDRKLTTGAINPGGSREPLARDPVFRDPEDPLAPNTPGLAVRFHEPVVNSAGPDVVFFELQVIVHPEPGDPFRVSPLRFAPGLRTHLVRSYDIDLASPEARTLAGFRLYGLASPPRSLGGLRDGRHDGGYDHPVRAKALAVGIDLSDLGYREGESADGLFIQDAQDDDNLVDPVFIAGLPPVGPETPKERDH